MSIQTQCRFASTITKFALITFSCISTVMASDYIAPAMENIPSGSFMMGSDTSKENEKPRRLLNMPEFQMAKYMVTVAEFRKFIENTNYETQSNCNDSLSKTWMSGDEGSASWDNNRFQESEFQPVTCVTWHDAIAYTQWLSNKTGTHYRLPTEAEWEYSLKANTTSRYFWGDDLNLTQVCLYANFADHSSEYFASKQYGASYVGFIGHVNCDDGEPYNSIVGLYRPNPFGLYDMEGNVKQFLGTCYYNESATRTKEELYAKDCERVNFRGTIWHFTPGPMTKRAGFIKDTNPNAILGFRIAADGHSDKTHESTVTFEQQLNKAQQKRIKNRPTLPAAPTAIQLVQESSNDFYLSWQPNTSNAVVGYDIYQSKAPRSHLRNGFYQPFYNKIATLDNKQTKLKVSLPKDGGSFRVVTKTTQENSLPSIPAIFINPTVINIPGRINLADTTSVENLNIKHRKNNDSELIRRYLIRYTMAEQIASKANYVVNVKRSGWYFLNYKGAMGGTGEFFKLWQGNKLLAKVIYDKAIDDKSSNRHKVFLEKGRNNLQLSVIRNKPDLWFLEWLELTEVDT